MNEEPVKITCGYEQPEWVCKKSADGVHQWFEVGKVDTVHTHDDYRCPGDCLERLHGIVVICANCEERKELID